MKLRRLRLSSFVTVLFSVALVLPWIAFAWLSVTSRATQLERTQQLLHALASAYAQHAVDTMRDPSGPDTFDMDAFRDALTLPDVTLSLHASGEVLPAADGAVLRAEFDRPDAGIAAVASIDRAAALKDWTGRSLFEAIGLSLRSLLALTIGIFLVQQLRWRERAQVQLAVAREKAEAASRAKSEFLANMSHELRTPLNAIIGFSEMIRNGMQGPLNARYREYGADIVSSGQHLLNLINEILDLSKLEAGRFVLHDESIELANVIRTSLRLVEAQAETSKVELRCSGLEGLPMIQADDRRLRQVFINLLSNAVKFTPEGGCVSVSAFYAQGGVAVEVRDTGIGMAKEDIAKALEPFVQIENAVSRNHDGTGLGLPLAKRLVEMHGGTLTIASELGVGTAVTVHLPAARVMSRSAHLVAV
jgi:signal transduction histidine kinase